MVELRAGRTDDLAIRHRVDDGAASVGDHRPDGSPEAEPTFRIGDLAREFSVTFRALRFYENRGLLSPGRAGLHPPRGLSRGATACKIAVIRRFGGGNAPSVLRSNSLKGRAD